MAEEMERTEWLDSKDIQKVMLSEDLAGAREGSGVKDHSSISVMNTRT